MKARHFTLSLLTLVFLTVSCTTPSKKEESKQLRMTAKNLLGNPTYQAISYGGYRTKTRDNQPTIEQLKEDMKILSAMGIRLLRTYNVHLPHAANLLKAIKQLRTEDPSFEMYLMLGAWIDCKNAWTDQEPDHNQESERNAAEIAKAVELTLQYPEIVKIIAVGNEAMVKWAAAYYVQPGVILKWVNHLQGLKSQGSLPQDLWITSSDDFSSWGGGSDEYHVEDLNQLIRSVDFISMHTYPMHNTHYNPDFWGILPEEATLTKEAQIQQAMKRSLEFAQAQYDSVRGYMSSLGIDKPIHIGETGWASLDNHLYGTEGSKATDEYKEGLFYGLMRNWTNTSGISCFYFEAFDEPWKDGQNPIGSENHFGIFTKEGKAKYALWPLVDQGTFEGLTRAGNSITKTFDGSIENLLEEVELPPGKKEPMVSD